MHKRSSSAACTHANGKQRCVTIPTVQSLLYVKSPPPSTEPFICEIAAAFNNGTPMSTGELLSFVRVQDTPRAKFLYQVVEDNPWVTHEFGIRSMGIKMVGMIIVHIEEKISVWHALLE